MTSFFETPFQVYTDGSVKEGRGSWAYVVVRKNRVIHEAAGFKKRPTNNQMEFQGAIEALRYLPKNSRVTLHTDSRVMIETMTVGAPLWRQQGWVKSRGRSIPNLVQIQELDALVGAHRLSWQWVRAHSGVRHNERCDELCIRARS